MFLVKTKEWPALSTQSGPNGDLAQTELGFLIVWDSILILAPTMYEARNDSSASWR